MRMNYITSFVRLAAPLFFTYNPCMVFYKNTIVNILYTNIFTTASRRE